MVTFYKPVKKAPVKKSAVKVSCSDLDLQGRGVARQDDRIYFVKGLMPGDTANVLEDSAKGKIVNASITKIITPSPKRRAPDCEYLGSCGGCQMQHVPPKELIDSKVEGIRRLFKKALSEDIGEPSFIHTGNECGYRRACRFAIRGDHGRLHLGFRQEKSHNLVQIKNCLTLTERINSAIEPVSKTLNTLEGKSCVGHIEFLDSDGALGILFRVTKKLSKDDEEKICALGQSLGAVISVVEPYRDPKLITKIEQTRERLLCGSIEDLFITSMGVKIKCYPSSFVQVNALINSAMLETVLCLVEPHEGQRVLDLFCGLGNFTLPLARAGASVVGVDIVAKMIEDARANAAALGLDGASFEIADLEEQFENQKWAQEHYDAVVMDPGRDGAQRASLFLCGRRISKIVYISCNPLAASRDTIELKKAGYRMVKWGVCDMFPRTTHVEMIMEFSL